MEGGPSKIKRQISSRSLQPASPQHASPQPGSVSPGPVLPTSTAHENSKIWIIAALVFDRSVHHGLALVSIWPRPCCVAISVAIAVAIIFMFHDRICFMITPRSSEPQHASQQHETFDFSPTHDADGDEVPVADQTN